jgi:hypothetical protein
VGPLSKRAGRRVALRIMECQSGRSSDSFAPPATTLIASRGTTTCHARRWTEHSPIIGRTRSISTRASCRTAPGCRWFHQESRLGHPCGAAVTRCRAWNVDFP